LENFNPSVNPPAEIDDPNDTKPETWIDTAQIPDPKAVKPDDWDEDAPYSIPDEDAEKPEGWLDDEPLQIPDPDAEKPEEWDDEEDGEWLAPTVTNPKCAEAPGCGEWQRPTKPNPNFKGKWSAPMIDHPEYKGPWAPRKIPNPNYFEDKHPANFHKIGGIGFEIWSMTEDILFDNIYVGHSVEDAKALADETFHVKRPIEKASAEITPPEPSPEEGGSELSFKDDPLEWIRSQAFGFYELAKIDPIAAFKSKPETGVAIIAVLLTFFGSLGALFGLVGGSQQAPVKSTKKDAPAKSEKKAATEAAATSTATEEKSGATKRK